MNRSGVVLTWTMVVIVTAAVAFGIATRYILKIKPAVSFVAARRSRDNRIEQACEKVILNQSGITVDLSPDVETKATMDLITTTNKRII